MSFWVGGIHICRSASRTLRSGILNKVVQRGWKARGEWRISRAVSLSASSPERDRCPLLALRNDAEERRGEALALQDLFDIEHLAAGAMSRRSSASVLGGRSTSSGVHRVSRSFDAKST